MGGAGWFLFLVIIICVLGLIGAVKRSKDDDEDTFEKEESTVSWSGPKPRETEVYRSPERTVRPSGPEQITMYAYNPPRRLQRCRTCDGENEVNAGFCRVCGTKLR